MERYKAVHLDIPNKLEFIELALSALEKYARIIGFNEGDINKMLVGTEEVIGNIIRHAYIDQEEGRIKIMADDSEKGILITIFDDGAPMDAELFNELDPKKSYKELPPSGFGLSIIRQFFDYVNFQTIGKEGNRTILEKYIHESDHFHPQTSEIGTFRSPVAKEKVKYFLAILDPKDAISVSKLAYIAYHHTYPYDPIYIPAKVKEMNRSGELISAVARLEDTKEIISHSGLVFGHGQKRIAEIGIAFTDPKYRGQGTTNRLWAYLLEEIAPERKIDGVYASCVTSHPYSQKVALKFNLKDVALFVAKTPVLDFENIRKNTVQRESIMMALRVYRIKEVDVIFPPVHHRQMIEEIFENLAVEIEIGLNPTTPKRPALGESVIRVIHDEVFNITEIKVDYLGNDYDQRIRKLISRLCIDKVEVVYLYFSLSNPYTFYFTETVEKMGFFFCGMMPDDNKFNLVFQYLNNQDIDYSALKINSDFGRRLLKYVEQCDPNVTL